jgi:alpha-beta hydrolase superfamily lysophospholipase
LHGDQDKRTEHKNSIMLNEKISSKDKTIIIVQGGNHQLLQDTKKIINDVKSSIKSWLLKH